MTRVKKGETEAEETVIPKYQNLEGGVNLPVVKVKHWAAAGYFSLQKTFKNKNINKVGGFTVFRCHLLGIKCIECFYNLKNKN